MVLHFELQVILAENNEIDLCFDDPGFDPDVSIVGDHKTMTQIWLGDTRQNLGGHCQHLSWQQQAKKNPAEAGFRKVSRYA